MNTAQPCRHTGSETPWFMTIRKMTGNASYIVSFSRIKSNEDKHRVLVHCVS